MVACVYFINICVYVIAYIVCTYIYMALMLACIECFKHIMEEQHDKKDI